MSINRLTVCEAVRKRIISVTNIDPLTQFAGSNIDFDPKGAGLWIREFSVGGEERMFTAKRSRISSFLIQYDFMVPLNSGTDTLETAVNAVMAEFDLASPTKSNVSANGLDIIVKSISRDSEKLKDYHREKLLFTLDVTTS